MTPLFPSTPGGSPERAEPDASAPVRRPPADEDLVHASGLDSFPASDPPGWWSGPDLPPG